MWGYQFGICLWGRRYMRVPAAMQCDSMCAVLRSTDTCTLMQHLVISAWMHLVPGSLPLEWSRTPLGRGADHPSAGLLHDAAHPQQCSDFCRAEGQQVEVQMLPHFMSGMFPSMCLSTCVAAERQ